MSELVIDASAAVEAAFAADGFNIYREHSLHAPSLLTWEVNSAINRHHWLGAITADIADEAIHRFQAQAIREEGPSLDFLRASTLVARRLGWATVYNAAYVALVLQLPGSRLVTRDERLRRGASRLVDIISPAEV